MTTNIEHLSDAQLVLAMDGELEQPQAASVAQHLTGCEICRTRLDRFGGISGQIVECHKALESGRLRVPVPVIARKQQIARAAGFVAAAAALALVALYLTQADKPIPVAHRTEAHPEERAAVIEKTMEKSVPLQKVRRAARRRPAPAGLEKSNIIELPFSDSALPLADATVVRVELPIEELRLTGLMVEGGRAGTVVQADVLMGIDGLPRAIRLVE